MTRGYMTNVPRSTVSHSNWPFISITQRGLLGLTLYTDPERHNAQRHRRQTDGKISKMADIVMPIADHIVWKLLEIMMSNFFVMGLNAFIRLYSVPSSLDHGKRSTDYNLLHFYLSSSDGQLTNFF